MTHHLLQTPIAIVGMACCLPGARNLTEFWKMLREGRDAISELPPDRLDRSLYYHPEKGRRGKTYSSLGGLIPDRPLTFLSSLLDTAELQNADLCHQILCDVAIEACIHGGIDVRDFPWRNTGVYVGHSGGSTLGGDLAFATLADETLDYLFDVVDFAAFDDEQARDMIRQTANRLRSGRPRRNATGGPDVEANYGAALVAKALRLNGPNFVIDAACASSLVALVAATLALNHGHIDAAIVGGASFNKADSLILFSQAHSCSARGTRPFDNQADGLISSEGYVALVVKLLPKAIADGDTIHAVIRGLGISSDGRGRSLWAPRKEGQCEAVRRAYGPGVEPRNVQFIEAHATSTQVGDATELDALAAFFGPLSNGRKIPIGSVKSNIGHTLETAGLAGLTKTVLALQHGEIPPTVNLNQLSSSVQWEQLPFTVPTEVVSWPRASPDQPRCAAVNAFGIGGLNVHVVVEEYIARTPPLAPGVNAVGSIPRPAAKPQGIAIIGRGAILPGASSLGDFAALLSSGRSALTDATDSRWRKKIGVRAGACGPGSSPVTNGGHILNYAYDWKTHKIPPKQIAQANPLQFMLLDAARAALVESGYDQKSFDQANTAVVVGNVFGGEFGNQLHIGLRLPEIRRELGSELRRHGLSLEQADRLVDEFERCLLQAKPALLDETGSFTSSTLASRISKTLNLMGGAMAIDAGDCSSLAALSVACDLLRSGASSLVLCAAAQRSMDLPAFESLALHGRLSGCPDRAGEGYLPGEGVVVVLLKPLDDAMRDGDRVWGVIEEVAAGMDSMDLSRAIELASQRALSTTPNTESETRNLEYGCGIATLDDAERRGLGAAYGVNVRRSPLGLVHQIGHTQAVHGLALLLKATINSPVRLTGISVHSFSGLAYHLLFSTPQNRLESTIATLPVQARNQADTSAVASAVPRIFRWSAETMEQLVQKVQQTAGPQSEPSVDTADSFSDILPARMAIVATSAKDLAVKVALTMPTDKQPASRAFLWEQGVFIHTRRSQRPRIALAFPGQGSQYPGMLQELVQYSAAAMHAMHEVDAVLKSLGLSPFSELVWGDADRLGSDILVTQLAMLLSDYLALAAIRECGVTPDCVVGHSFGEFPALIAAQALTLRQAVELTLARTRAIETAGAQRSAMLSINASPQAVHALLSMFQGRVFLSHHNAPEQIVVGGLADAVIEFESGLASEGFATRRLNVPTAFHTELMQPMLVAWRESLKQADFAPPRVPVLSSVTNKYVADPDDIRNNLALQMVTPVRYVELVNRLAQAGIDAIVEVGPQQVLTRLHRRILASDEIVCTAMDHPKRSAHEQICRVVAELECLGWQPAGTVTNSSNDSVPTTRHAIEHFDATEVRKARRRNQSRPTDVPKRSAEPVQLFDATQARRERRRGQTPVLASQEAAQPTIQVPPPAAEALTSPAASDAAAISTQQGHDNLEQVLIDFVMEHTGYPAELINFDWDLEADLGIDSIKRAQLFGELRELFQLDTSDRASLEEYRTLRQIADLLRAQGATPARQTEPLAVPLSRSAAPTLPTQTPQYDAHRVTASAAATQRRALEKFLIDFVVDQTGYPSDVVDLDADFEADLGIDSIKKSQLFGELREQFQLNVSESDRFSLANFGTLRHVLALLDEGSRQEGPPMSSPVIATVRSPALAEKQELSFQRQTGSLESRSTRDTISSLLSAPNGSKHEANELAGDARYLLGLKRGRQHSASIRSLLRRSADRHFGSVTAGSGTSTAGAPNGRFSRSDLSELRGLADGAGVHFDNVLAYQSSAASQGAIDIVLRIGGEISPPDSGADKSHFTEPTVASRYVLHIAPRPLRTVVATSPQWSGAAVILGDNELAQAIRQRFAREGRNAYIVRATDEPGDAVRDLDRIWQQEPAPHLFIVTPRDNEATTTWNADAFDRRRRRGVSTPFWFCQRWVKLTTDAGLMNSASVVGVTSLGGDFGFSGQVTAVESGAITGLLKSIIIESWVGGFRTLPIKLIDSPASTSSEELVESMWRELAAPSYDVEIAVKAGERFVVRAHRQAIDELPRAAPRKGGNWVCTGGARGITAHAARELAARFGLRLHLLGLSPLPQIPDRWRTFSAADLKQLKLEVMQSARVAGRNSIKEWEQVEKALEIDRTLRELREQGISARYHSCDVSDRHSLGAVLDEIRRVDGPIDGVLHGAGVGKDARFDRKEPKRVEECIRAKVDGARALMELTRRDPLQYFVAFGSISGRFGANGHTDYSLANDMLCKQVDWFRRERPEVKSVAFHWHAWGDVGMATKPETKLALEMVGMQFMPAAEGVSHLIGELEAVTSDSEVLITDDKYYRLFYPAETLDSPQDSSANISAAQGSLLREATVNKDAGGWVATVTLDPAREPFLIEHRLDDRPVLPIVVGMELLAEAAVQCAGGGRVAALRDVEALRGLRFHTDRPLDVRVRVTRQDEQKMHCELLADFFSRDGQLVEADRCYLRGDVRLSSECSQESGHRNSVSQEPSFFESRTGTLPVSYSATGKVPVLQDGWEPVQYPVRGSKMYLGPPLQCLRKARVDQDVAWGRIIAPALIELSGSQRSVEGWIVPSAAVDACLFATGLLCWSRVAPGATLPVRFGGIELGRMPQPGEACVVETRFLRRDGRFAVFDFALFGDDGCTLVRVKEYHVAWITG